MHKIMFTNVAAEAITAIMTMFLLSSDEICFIWIFEQSTVVDAKVDAIVNFVDVSRATSNVIVFGAAGFVIGS